MRLKVQSLPNTVFHTGAPEVVDLAPCHTEGSQHVTPKRLYDVHWPSEEPPPQKWHPEAIAP